MSYAASIGIRVYRGGAIAVVVAHEDPPRVLLSTLVPTADPDDRQSLEPFHLAFAASTGANAGQPDALQAIIDRGRQRQNVLAAAGLARIKTAINESGYKVRVVALLVNRAVWVNDLLSYSLAYKEHLPVAETLAVRDAIRFAVRENKLSLTETDEKSLPGLAAEQLRLTDESVAGMLKNLGAGIKPWRKEHKLACLCALIAHKG